MYSPTSLPIAVGVDGSISLAEARCRVLIAGLKALASSLFLRVIDVSGRLGRAALRR
jgi:hypothetical protein